MSVRLSALLRHLPPAPGATRLLAQTLAWLVIGALPPAVFAAEPSAQAAVLEQIDYRQRIGNQLPNELRFRNAQGELIDIGSLTEGKPLLLALAWYNCPQLCPMLLDRIADATEELPFDSDAYRVAIVSIAPEEGPADARRIHAELRNRHGKTTGDWHLLTGKKPAIDALADAAGFRYAHDPASGDYAHPAGLMVAAAGGQVSHYLLGMRPEAPDLRLALMEASQGELGSPLQKVLVRCYRFDPETGQYNLAIMNLLRFAGGGSALALAGAIVWMRRRERA